MGREHVIPGDSNPSLSTLLHSLAGLHPVFVSNAVALFFPGSSFFVHHLNSFGDLGENQERFSKPLVVDASNLVTKIEIQTTYSYFPLQRESSEAIFFLFFPPRFQVAIWL